MKVKSKPLYQWCIRETYVSELEKLPKELTVEGITFEIGFSLKRVVSTIPAKMRELGVVSLREPTASMEAYGLLTGSRSTLFANAKEICKELHLDYRHMRARRFIVSLNGTKAYFTRMTKAMDTGEENKTHRIKVMGLVKVEGSDANVNKIIQLLTAKKIHCTYSVKPITTVICTE